MVEIDRHKASLIAELEISRSEVRNALAHCEESLDVVSQLRRNVQENKVAWIAGAGLLGYVASRILRHSMGRTIATIASPASKRGGDSTTGHRQNRALDIGAFIFDLAKPTLLAWVSSRLPTLLSRASSPSPRASAPAPAQKPEQRGDQPTSP
jgi:hypothetical protein